MLLLILWTIKVDAMQKHRSFIQAVVACLLVLGSVGPMVRPPQNALVRMQPLLAQMAAEAPDQPVSVIVQKADASADIRDLIDGLGGEITADLRLINAYAAVVPASDLPRLAAHPAVRWISLDAPMAPTYVWNNGACAGQECIDTSHLHNAYIRAIRADQVWNEPPYIQGQGVTVAIVDSGVEFEDQWDLNEAPNPNSPERILAKIQIVEQGGLKDKDGHGTHIAGIIGGNGARSAGSYIGVAPKVNLLSLKVVGKNANGSSTMSDVVAALQWIYDHKEAYNIRVVNLSFNSSVAESYHTSPLSAAVEILWFNGVVVVAAAGNNGGSDSSGTLYPPANDPFVITVGASDDHGTANPADDQLASYSAYGVTSDGFHKPDLVAPGTNIISLLSTTSAPMFAEHPDHRVGAACLAGQESECHYFRLSGTSMSAPVVAGAVALLLQSEPDLTPDQVKYRLMTTARPLNSPAPGATGAGQLDVYAAIHTPTAESANIGIAGSQLLWSGEDPALWDSVNWNAVNWNAVNWNAVNWNAVNWNAVNWNATYWGD